MNQLDINLRRQARLSQKKIEECRLSAHAKVALMLRSADESDLVIQSAREQIALWRAGRLCSPDFIESWECLLANSADAAAVLEDISPASVRLRQNSPFAAFLR